MTFFGKLDCLVINLDRSPERLVKMRDRLEQIQLPFRKVSAVDGKLVTFTDKEINKAKYEEQHGKYVTPTEVACYISHYNAMLEFLNTDKDYALILEDDMEFCDDFPRILEELLKINHKWDMVKLNGTTSWSFPIIHANVYKQYNLVCNVLHQAKSGAYLINRKAAESYVDCLLPMTVPYDHEFIKYWKYSLKGFAVHPFPSWEEGTTTTIDYSMIRSNRKPWYKRSSTLVYRTGVTLRRLLYAVTMK